VESLEGEGMLSPLSNQVNEALQGYALFGTLVSQIWGKALGNLG